MPVGLRVRDDIVVPANELQWRFSRSSGPGGQSVNTSDSRVELRLDVIASSAFTAGQRLRLLERLQHRLHDGVLTVVASEHRAQLRNREAAERRLARLLSDALAPPPAPRRPTRPSRSAVRRRLDGKRLRGELKRSRRAPEG